MFIEAVPKLKGEPLQPQITQITQIFFELSMTCQTFIQPIGVICDTNEQVPVF